MALLRSRLLKSLFDAALPKPWAHAFLLSNFGLVRNRRILAPGAWPGAVAVVTLRMLSLDFTMIVYDYPCTLDC
jgi:predicted nicotinamide N-methyase